MSDGTRQCDRFPAALAPDWFRVDERRFEQLLTTSVGFAGFLDFIDADGRPLGRWGEAFAGDETVVLAGILDLDADRLQARFVEDCDRMPVSRLVRDIIRLIRQIDLWFKAVSAGARPLNGAIADCIARLITASLAGDADWVLQKFENSPLLGPLAARTAGDLDPIWMGGGHREPVRQHHRKRDHLRSVFGVLLHAVQSVQAVAIVELDRSLESRTHEPAAALLIASVKAFQTVQQWINRFGDRRIDFYYRHVLQMQPNGATAGRVHLLVQREQTTDRRVVIPAGTRFIGGKDAAGRAIQFAADALVEVGKARVVDLYTFRLERDPLISPECEIGYVTRASISRLDGAAKVTPGGACNGWPLFGGDIRAGSGTEQDARIGLAIASPLLWLKEGDRTIRITLELALSGETSGLSAAFGRWLLARDDRMDTETRTAIGRVVQSVVDPDLAARREERALPSGDLVLDHLSDGLFGVSLTTSLGWYAVPRVEVTLLPEKSGVHRVQLEMNLPAAAPAVIGPTAALHGGEWPPGPPLIRLLVTREARLFPLSLFDGVPLAGIGIEVEVKGVREIALSNQMGLLDASKPFAPFGPLPDTASYLVIGAPELSRKPLDELTFHLTWSGLPAEPGGFTHLYRGYGPEWHQPPFSVSLSILKDGRWMPPTAADRTRPLFAISVADDRLMSTSTVPVDGTALATYWRAGDSAVSLERGARNGLVRLKLAAPPGAFGHQVYPQLLTQRVGANARRRHPEPLPNPPYTPLVERLTLDYRASRRVLFGRDGAAAGAADDERVLHVHPLGLEQIHPMALEVAPTVLPRYEYDGNLFIGLTADAVAGPLTLLFELCDELADARKVRANPQPRMYWSFLDADRWNCLPEHRILSDTTSRFLTSGLVALDLPSGIRCDNRRMPDGLFWLRVSTDADSGCFAGLHAVQAQAFSATRVTDTGQLALPVGAGCIKGAAVALEGVLSVIQPSASFGERAAEDEAQFRIRVGERLRHKDRGCRPWDYERLVLDGFPCVFMAKCFDNRQSPDLDLRGGQVLVAVVPRTERNDPTQSTRELRLNVAVLDQIQRFLSCRCSPFARITVRNASYERIQLRCTVRLETAAPRGPALKRIKRAIIEYLSPWHDVGYGARFDWIIRGEDLESHLRSLPEVHTVTRMSLLHIGESELPPRQGSPGMADYWLSDTARQPGEIARLHGREPWSLALPLDEHLIEIADEEVTHVRPHRSGIAQLAIGDTFIVTPGARNLPQPSPGIETS